MQTDDGCILKPVQNFPQGEREHNFYKRMAGFKTDNEEESDSKLILDEIGLKKLIPSYKGSIYYNDRKIFGRLLTNIKIFYQIFQFKVLI